MKTLLEYVTEQINHLSTIELVALNNIYCRENNIEDEVYDNDEEFFELFFENKAMEAVRAAHFGNYNFGHDYVKFNGYGNLESFQYFNTDDLCELVSVIAEYAIDNQSEFGMLDFDFEEETEEAE